MNSTSIVCCFRLLIVSILAVVPSSAFAVDDNDVDKSVVSALKFLAKQQRPTGAWDAPDGTDSTAATSLAVMAFLAAGHVPGEGPYGAAIDGGIGYVLSHQNANGMLVRKSGHGPMYEHGISTLMLAEVVGMTKLDQAANARSVLSKAVRLILEAQLVKKGKNHVGGWRYQRNSKDSDLSVTAWQLLALRAAKDIGCDVPAESIDLAVQYVKQCSSGTGFAYQPGHGPMPTMTASGVLALEICDHHDDELVAKGIEHIQGQPMRIGDSWFFYGAYYTSISAYKYGGPDWEVAKSRLFKELLGAQQPNGSWVARNNEAEHGPVYATSLSVLALTVEYGYLPIYQR